jgi:hypothetical protein
VAISKLRALNRFDDPNLQRTIDNIYDTLNDLINTIKPNIKGAPSKTDGKDGDIRVYKDRRTGYYVLSSKVEGDWVSIGLTRDDNGKPFKGFGVIKADLSTIDKSTTSGSFVFNNKTNQIEGTQFLEAKSLSLKGSDSFILEGGDIVLGSPTNAGTVTLKGPAHNSTGHSLSISAGNATPGTSNDQNGGNLILNAGRGKGTGTGGSIILKVADASGVSGSILNSLVTALTINDDTTASFNANLSIGGELDVNGNKINYDAGHSYISVGENSGTNAGGYRLIFQSGKSTGSASGGNIYFDISDSGSSGSSVNMHTSQTGIGSGFFALKATNKLYFDGVHASGNTYIVESASDVLDIYVGGDKALSLDENTGYIDVDSNWTFRAGAPSNSNNRLKLLPSDFVASDGGRPVMIDDTGSDRWLESHSTLPMFASKEIPKGYKATHVYIAGSATSAITIYEASYDSKSVTSKGTGNIGTAVDITDVNSTDTNYLLIELAQASGEEVYGGYITISEIT